MRLDIGTQCSLVRLHSGNFVLLDAYTLTGKIETKVRELTDGGKRLNAIINLHPFHTIHVGAIHRMFPNAKLYGSSRHQIKWPALPWETQRVNSLEFAELYKGDFEFTVPEGVDFISKNEMVHFSSVLVFHPASKTLHVDDTLNFIQLPGPLKWTKPKGILQFHNTLSKALEKRPGAAEDFRRWAAELIDRCKQVDQICAAHTHSLAKGSVSMEDRVSKSLQSIEDTLHAHYKKYV